MNPLLAGALTGIQNGITAGHTFVYRRSRGRLGASFGRVQMLLLTTTGAKTGKKRTQPLLYTKHGDAFVLIASNGGAPRHPAWFHNLQANRTAQVEVGGRKLQVRFRLAKPAERDRLWKQMTRVWPLYDGYQHRADREIPVVILTPVSPLPS